MYYHSCIMHILEVEYEFHLFYILRNVCYISRMEVFSEMLETYALQDIILLELTAFRNLALYLLYKGLMQLIDMLIMTILWNVIGVNGSLFKYSKRFDDL